MYIITKNPTRGRELVTLIYLSFSSDNIKILLSVPLTLINEMWSSYPKVCHPDLITLPPFFPVFFTHNPHNHDRLNSHSLLSQWSLVISYDIPLKIPIKNKACITQTKGKPYLFNHFLKTPILVKMYSARTVQKTTSNPMLFMIFYWRKFFYLINI